tara:strand:+ start:2315 stop:3526 length:1212 start_codon:yes stop_codon:yes gene_type:complete
MFALAEITQEDRLYRGLCQVLEDDRYCCLAGTAQLGEFKIVDDFPTAYTDGRNVYFGREFITKLTDAEIRGVIVHELAHIFRRHMLSLMWMWEKDSQLSNVVWDMVINIQITEENAHDKFAVLPEPHIYDAKYKGKTEVQVWEDMYKEGQGGQGGKEGDGEGSGGFDEHGVEKFRELTEQEQKDLDDETTEAIRQGLLAAEKSGKPKNQNIADLVAVKIPWDSILQEWMVTTFGVGEDATFRKPNKRYLHMDIIRPTAIQDSLKDVLVAIDTSGSCCNAKVLSKFLSIVRNILETVSVNKVHLLFWDTEIRRYEVYGQGHAPISELVNTTMQQGAEGGGGTSPNCIPLYMEQHNIKPEGAIVLTDGYIWGGWGDGLWDCPVLWGILNNPNAVPTNNKKVDVTI